jgi:phage protein D
MIHKNPYGISPTLEIVVGNASFDYTAVNRVEITLEENHHDILTLDLSGIPPRAITDYYYKPVDVSLYTGGNFYHRFVGYVADVRPKSFTGFGLMNNSPFQDVEIVCMGASYNMRGKTSYAWNGYRLSDIARTMASKYEFSLDVPSDRTINPSLLQANESDWQFLTRYAKFLGYSVNVHGTHMHIYDPFQALSRQNSYHVLTTIRKTRGGVTPAPGQIIEFNATFSRRHIDGEYKETFIPIIDDVDNSTFEVSTAEIQPTHNGFAKYKNRESRYAVSYSEAERRINAIAKDDYDYYADVKVLGVAGAVPGGIVLIDNYNGDFDTYWYVQQVKHYVHSDAFYTELKIARNLNSELKFTNTRKFQTPPTAVYSKGNWIAENRTVNEYS